MIIKRFIIIIIIIKRFIIIIIKRFIINIIIITLNRIYNKILDPGWFSARLLAT